MRGSRGFRGSWLSRAAARHSLRSMNTRLMAMLVLLLPAFGHAADSDAPAKSDSKSAATDSSPIKLDLEVRREIALDDEVMRTLERATDREKELSPGKLFREPGGDLAVDSRLVIDLRPRTTAGPFPDHATTRCNLAVCRVYDDRGRMMYSYREPRLGVDVPATREMWQACQARQNDLLSTFERADRCHGIQSSAPSPWDPAPRAWP